GTSISGTLRMDVTGTESVSVNGSSYSTYHVAATLTIPFGSLTLNLPATIWYSTDTLAIVKIVADVNLTFGTVTTNSTGAVRYTQMPLATHFEVQTDASITVPAGTFTTSPLKETAAGSTSFVINYWSPQAGNSVRTESHNSSGQSAGSYNLTSYRYQAGSLLTTVFLGLQVWIWLILLVLVVAAVVGAVLVRRRRPGVGAPPPGWTPPQQPPSGPEPPESPP